jgi:hypothetical protein
MYPLHFAECTSSGFVERESLLQGAKSWSIRVQHLLNESKPKGCHQHWFWQVLGKFLRVADTNQRVPTPLHTTPQVWSVHGVPKLLFANQTLVRKVYFDIDPISGRFLFTGSRVMPPTPTHTHTHTHVPLTCDPPSLRARSHTLHRRVLDARMVTQDGRVICYDLQVSLHDMNAFTTRMFL